MGSSDAVIIQGIKTRSEVSDTLRELDLLERSLYKTGEEGFAEKMRSSVGMKTAEIVRRKMDEEGTGENVEAMAAVLKELRMALENLSVIGLEVAIDPTQEMVEEIYAWVEANMGKGMILDFVVDKDILGGARVTYAGKYIDATLEDRWRDCWARIRSGEVTLNYNLKGNHD